MFLKRQAIRSWLFLFVWVGVLTGCQSPFPEEGRIQGEKPDESAPAAPPYGMAVPDQLEFREGIESTYSLDVWVPKGNPVLSLSGLPEGASFDEETMELSWLPGYEAANDENDATVKIKHYPVDLQLWSSTDAITSVRKRIVLVVSDHRRTLMLSGGVESIEEGEEKGFVFTVESEDHPEGPFDFFVEGMPVGMEFETVAGSSNQFRIDFTPAVDFVKVTEDYGYWWRGNREVEIKVIALDPSGRRVEKEYVILTKDRRLDPLFVTPDQIEMGRDGTFTISAMDPNREESPKLRLKEHPRHGLVEWLGEQEMEEDWTSTLTLRWSEIPRERVGETHTFIFEACVYKTYNQDHCIDKEISVALTEPTHLPPTINRFTWDRTGIKYVLAGEELASLVGVSDVRTGRSVDVEVFSSDEADTVGWRSGRLTVQSSRPGLKVLTLRAETDFGKVATETFLYEVLPQDWSPILVLTEDPRRDEVRDIRRHLESPNVLSPSFQALDERNLSFRDTLVITQSALVDQWNAEKIEAVTDGVSNILVLASNLEFFEGALKEELEGYGVTLAGRWSQLAGTPDLSLARLELSPRSTLSRPDHPVRIDGGDPMLLRTTFSVCESVFALDGHAVGVACDRPLGGKLVVVGFEWDSIQVSANDANKIRNWLKELL